MAKDYTTPCKDIKKLHPMVQFLLGQALALAKHRGVTPLVIETLRTQERQWWLYCQNRSVGQCTAKGIPYSFALNNVHKGITVTWTLNSIHLNRRAVDVIPQRNGKAVWDINDKDTKILIQCMESLGFTAGANWEKNTDSPHYQIDFTGNTFSSDNTTKEITTMIQNRLNIRLRYIPGYIPLKEDGDWGARTDRAVNQFKALQHWKQDCKVGLPTLKKLF